MVVLFANEKRCNRIRGKERLHKFYSWKENKVMEKHLVTLHYTDSGHWALENVHACGAYRKGTVPAGHVHAFIVTMMETLTPIAWTRLVLWNDIDWHRRWSDPV